MLAPGTAGPQPGPPVPPHQHGTALATGIGGSQCDPPVRSFGPTNPQTADSGGLQRDPPLSAEGTVIQTSGIGPSQCDLPVPMIESCQVTGPRPLHNHHHRQRSTEDGNGRLW